MNRLMIFLDAIRDHLDSHQLPPAASVDVNAWSSPITVQLDVDGLAKVARALLVWSQTLEDVSARLWRLVDGKWVHISITGRTPCGIPVAVFGVVRFEPSTFPDLPAGAKQDMPVYLLRGWSTPGEVAA
ncbi:hypothetical protein AMES_5829 [Amycolatopsis mediterranei S699]|uniref:Uncharacterized protein n=2 Tax=Amycolatopsis mediterranei TaxID=33910 RepID=A0A0H3DDE1_AMYMU|nr:hypothetical protein [Amycolatopsis mediterranei]ADJ47654.1 hypothetical protein AMED_5911 [Amycolatopsis mediterranei U32]AEK44539.1 hypothetical protein RAM_30320 [Amycolatopsis mediterranei S699]AFO79365.1 hypothetical protein AMES_5829 [Amycolatopsis mediterranei S699]AGT86493.1 hypothetical protein B737_5829 [Amycolatopsis mediterranei RB]KDO11835.1 hypothetical protein DV26_05215 [Amycolatopsis mediterranei]